MEHQTSTMTPSRLAGVKALKSRVAASSSLVALATLVTVLGAPWKW